MFPKKEDRDKLVYKWERKKLSKKQKKFIKKKKRDTDREQLAMIRIENEGNREQEHYESYPEED